MQSAGLNIKGTNMIFIPFNVPSLKNGKTPVSLPGKKHSTLVPAPEVKKYLQKIGVKKYRTKLNKKQKDSGMRKVEHYANRPNLFRAAIGDYFKNAPRPAIVKFHFVRDSKRKFDFCNAVAIIEDLLTAHDFIRDDCMDYFIPLPMILDGEWYSVDPVKPGVWIKIVEI